MLSIRAHLAAPALLALLPLLACGTPPAPAPGGSEIVVAPPSAAPTAAPIAPSAAPTAAAIAPSAAPTATAVAPAPIDRTTCRPKPPAVSFEVKDDDVVTPLDASGCPLGESHFKANGYSYRAAVDFFTELQKRLRAGDKKGLGELARYPVRVNMPRGAALVIKDDKGFSSSFDKVYSPGVTAAVLKQDPRDVSASSKGLMLGDGIVWADGDKGVYGVIAVNTP
ncbi:MAG: hypothetical protein U0359_32750 [Byssovorax sp.]